MYCKFNIVHTHKVYVEQQMVKILAQILILAFSLNVWFVLCVVEKLKLKTCCILLCIGW